MKVRFALALASIVGRSVGRLDPAGRASERWTRRSSGLVISIVGAVALTVLVWHAIGLVHEVTVLVGATLLARLSANPVLDDLVGLLPINEVYARAILRFVGQIEVAGLHPGPEITGVAHLVGISDAGATAVTRAAAIIAPGSALLARVLASSLANLAILGAGVCTVAFACRGVSSPDLGSMPRPRLALVIAGITIQAEVVARVLRDRAIIADLETIGVTPFIFHQLLRLHTSVYDSYVGWLSATLDPILPLVLVLGLYIALWAFQGVTRAISPSVLVALCRGRGVTIGWRTDLATTPATSSSRRFCEALVVAILAGMLPVVQQAAPATSFLDWIEGSVHAAPVMGEGSALKLVAAEKIPHHEDVVDVASGVWEREEPIVERVAEAAHESTRPLTADAASVVVFPRRHYRRPADLQRREFVVSGRDYHYSLIVDGEPTEFRGMGYNVTFHDRSAAERRSLLDRDFAHLKDMGVNILVGWRSPEWDHTVLDAAHRAGLMVVLPFDFDPALDYSDANVRRLVRRAVVAWVQRYRDHPAVAMWGLGNETLLGMRQTARAKAFGQFYAETVDLLRQIDPDHPVMAREAEDVYYRWIADAWRPRGGAPEGFIVGMNFYTFRMRDAIESWPRRGIDAPIVVSEFAPAGLSREDRPAGYRRAIGMIRARPESVLGLAPYVWNVDGPEPSDRVFGLFDRGRPVDGTVAALSAAYRSFSPIATIVPSVVSMDPDRAHTVLEGVGMTIDRYAYQPIKIGARRGGVPGKVMFQDPPAGVPLVRGARVRLVIGYDPTPQAWPLCCNRAA
ncbi:MAG: hypothetical protein FJ033_00985 [Chloroflexi bacterium]|nr:hypothetical protein [Chloroflexota bacterium]